MSTVTTHKKLTFIHDDTEFYPHQVEGIRTLARRSSFLLADEPGLGKSLQALTVFAIDVQRGVASRMLIICPATLKSNWMEEIAKHTDFRAMVLDNGPKAAQAKSLGNFIAGDYHILIVNYEQVPAFWKELNALNFDMVVYDEAQNIKNKKSKRTKACHALYAPRHALLTGTPIMNNVGDLWSLLYRIDPVAFPNYYAFVNRYAVFGGYQGKAIVGVKNERELKAKLDDYMLRRRKTDVLDLPEKQRIVVPVDLHPEQTKLYRQIKVEMKLVLPQEPDPIDVQNALDRMVKLKQVCGTTATMPGYEDHSYKLDRAEELVEELAENGHHMVIFTQFREVLAAFQHRLESLGAPLFILNGDVPMEQRAGIVRAWSEYPRPAVLLSMLQVGGVGLNMTKARHLIFLDKDWTPAINEQAEDRIHRIGASKTQPVQIIELICRKTVESRVEQILRQKQKVFDAVVNDSDFKRKLIAALAEEDDD